MKKILFILVLFLEVQICFGQKLNIKNNKADYLIDSAAIAKLMADLHNAAEDTAKVVIMHYLVNQYSNDLDSSLHYSFKALNLSRKIGYSKGELTALNQIQVALKHHGMLLKAFSICHKGLKASRKYHDKYFEANFLGELGILYTESGLLPEAMTNLRKSKALYDSIGDYYSAAYEASNIGEVYLKKNDPDSALMLCRSSLKKLVGAPANAFWIPIYITANLGNIFMAQSNYDSAIHYFKVSKQIGAFHSHQFRANLGIAKVFDKMNLQDSSLFYAGEANRVAIESGVYNFNAEVNDFLANFYRRRDINKSIDYAKTSLAYKDSLYRQSVTLALENFDELDEQEKQFEIQSAQSAYQFKARLIGLLAGIAMLLIILGILIRNYRQKQNSIILLNKQKEEINTAKEKTEIALSDLKSTQTQLIHSEKMASLGELTAGIAHEIQNPLNFVNNFSEVNTELVEDLKTELSSGHYKTAEVIADNIKENQEKINHHGKRADAIVKNMLQHSRRNTGQKELIDINAWCDEYIRLAYHGLRAKDKSFHAKFETEFDSTIGKISVVPQDIGRVIINLINNAFYTVNEKSKVLGNNYEPIVTVITKKGDNKVFIMVKDNGQGIPIAMREKIFQPFFTTKPAGHGTGLGLSLAYDIVTKTHGGDLSVETKEGEGSEFIIALPF